MQIAANSGSTYLPSSSIAVPSKIIDGLYLIGEILDVDGECGGYNLGFCFITGIKAGNNIKW